MANTTSPLLPDTLELLKAFGQRLRLARLRRRLQAREVAERAGMTETTLRKIEHGAPGATIGAYLAVLQVLQMNKDVAGWAADDPVGRQLQDSPTHGGLRPRRRRHIQLHANPLTVKVSAGPAGLSVKPRAADPAPAAGASTQSRRVTAADLLQAIFPAAPEARNTDNPSGSKRKKD